MPEQISIERAVSIGMLWLNGTVVAGIAVGFGAVGLVVQVVPLETAPVWVSAPVLAGGLLVATVIIPWLGWSWQAPRWRLWAYRRVDDIEELKRAAIEAKLIWPDGHVFERTELRSRDQSIELAALEGASRRRTEAYPEPAMAIVPTRLGAAGKALAIGLSLTLVIVLVPVIILLMLGLDVLTSPVFLGIMVLSSSIIAAAIYVRARRDGVTADEAYRRVLPRGIRRKDDA